MDTSTGSTCAHPAVTALAAVDAGLAELAAANLWSMSERELLDVRVDAEATRGRLESVVLAMTREIDGRGAAVRVGASSTAAWLRSVCRQRPALAHGEVRLAAELDRDLPAVAAAVAAGQVPYESARVIADTLRKLPAGWWRSWVPRIAAARQQTALDTYWSQRVGISFCQSPQPVPATSR